MKEKVVFKEKKKPLSASDKVFNVFNYLLFGLLTLICLYPFYYLIINTISANDGVNDQIIKRIQADH